MTPVEIEVLLHCYYSPEPIPRLNVPAVSSAVQKLHNLKLIEITTDSTYTATSRGRAMVELIKAVPIPIQKTVWVHPITEEVIK